MSKEPAEDQPHPSNHLTPVEKFISLLVPEPELLEEETSNDTDREAE